MALVKTCPTCGVVNVPTSPFCSQCGVSLIAVAASEHVKQAVKRFDPQGSDSGKRVCPDCKAENEIGAKRCVYCDCALGSVGDGPEPCHIELVWPWGTERLTKTIRIGREPPSPESLIKEISARGYDNISRSHAELLLDPISGGLSVIDLGSSNGTFVDGVRIPSNKPTVLKNGAVVRFAANLSVTIVLHDANRTEQSQRHGIAGRL